MRPADVGEWIPLLECRRLPKAGGLYVLRCKGKLYVGKSMDVQRRAYKHCRPERFRALVSRAVLAHGAAAFEVMLWSLSEDEEALLVAEVDLIALLGSQTPNGYNLTAGGEGSRGFRHSPETIAAIAEKNRGKKRPAAAVEATAAANRGKVRSEESRANISASLVGRTVSAEGRANMSAAKKGRSASTAGQLRINEGMKKSDAVKANIRAISERRQRQVLMWAPDSMIPTMEFDSVKEAAAYIGVQRSDVSNYCRGAEARSGNRFAYLE